MGTGFARNRRLAVLANQSERISEGYGVIAVHPFGVRPVVEADVITGLLHGKIGE